MDTVIFSEFNWKIVFSKIIIHISKPLTVFDKLGLGSRYRGNSVSAHRVEKMQRHRGCPNKITAAITILNQAGERGDCKLA